MYKAFLFHSMPFPSLFYYYHKINSKLVTIEAHENYQKKGLRNKYYIHHSHGIQALIIPLEKGKNNKCDIKEVRISDNENWQYFHLKSLRTAYNNSPFFEYYIEELSLLFRKRYKFLWDFNLATRAIVSDLLAIEPKENWTQNFIHMPQESYDYRNQLPKDANVTINQSYSHVFELKEPDLHGSISILDMLFCKGPEVIELLKDIKLSEKILYENN